MTSDLIELIHFTDIVFYMPSKEKKKKAIAEVLHDSVISLLNSVLKLDLIKS